MTDILILRGTLDTNSAVSADWNKLGALFFLQIVSTFVQIGSKGSLDFDYKLATAVPTDFIQSDYVPDSSEVVDYDVPELPEGFGEFQRSSSAKAPPTSLTLRTTGASDCFIPYSDGYLTPLK